MSGANDGAGGQGGAAAAQGDAGAAAAAQGAQGAGAAALAGNDAAKAPDFLSGVPENARDYVTNKGWKSATDMLTSYQKLESAMGSNKVALPKEGDAESEKAFRAALGVPESADKYDIKLPEGAAVDKEFLATAKNWMHEAGLTPKQAQLIASKWNEFTGTALKDGSAAKLRASEDGMAEIEKEWGAKTDANKAAAQRAFKTFSKAAGMEAADLDSIEEAIGTAKMMKLFASIGNGLAESRFIDGGPSQAGSFTPEAARARIAELKTDTEWFKKFVAGDVAANNEWKALQAAAAGVAA